MRDIDAQAGRDPTPLEDDVLEQLEKHGVPTALCDKIMSMLDEYQQEIAATPPDDGPLPGEVDALDMGKGYLPGEGT
jgi:hypothetical protein